jgi:hypothetical protein
MPFIASNGLTEAGTSKTTAAGGMNVHSRFAACPSLLTSPATRRPPPKCGAFRL